MQYIISNSDMWQFDRLKCVTPLIRIFLIMKATEHLFMFLKT